MRRDRLVWITALVAMLVLGAAPAQGQTPGPALAPCADVPAEFNARCGSVTVPLDRANPGLGTTQIAFAVLARRDVSRPSLGMLFGPHSGGPMIDAAPQLVGTFGALLDRRELLIMDSRGGGRSEPALCDSLREVTFGLVTPPARMTRRSARAVASSDLASARMAWRRSPMTSTRCVRRSVSNAWTCGATPTRPT